MSEISASSGQNDVSFRRACARSPISSQRPFRGELRKKQPAALLIQITGERCRGVRARNLPARRRKRNTRPLGGSAVHPIRCSPTREIGRSATRKSCSHE